MTEQNHSRGLLYAALAALAFSPASVFIRLTGDVGPWEMTFLRMFLASMALLAAALIQKEKLSLLSGEAKLFLPFSFITALHFLSFTAALERTSIAHSLALTYTAPIFAALLAHVFLKEHLRDIQWLGIICAVTACSLLCFAFSSKGSSMSGNMLALLSGLSLGCYHVIGRSVRTRIPLLKYAFWIYFGASIFLLPLAWPFPSTYSNTAITGILLQGLLCTALAHTLSNAALRHTATAYVSLIVAQEVTGGIIVGALALDEYPSPSIILSIFPLMLGLLLVLKPHKLAS